MPNKRAHNAHLVIVDAYQGHFEHLGDEPAEMSAAAGLGLPLADIAGALGCRITLLDWSQWYEFEKTESAFARWMPFPAARPLEFHDRPACLGFEGDARITRRPVPARDPDLGHPLALGLSPRSYGLLAESDPLFLKSYILNDYLEMLHRTDPIDAVIVPMFGGLGYVAQLSRATGAGLREIPFAVVVTGTSADRQAANGEGHWTRPAITRRQSEDLSLGLADLAICFGPQGRMRAQKGHRGPVVMAPRFVAPQLLDRIEASCAQPAPLAPLSWFLHEPKQGASGALVALDATRLLHARGQRPSSPLGCSGRNMRFPPNFPRDFDGYWSGRGWVRTLVDEGYWRWDDAPQPAAGSYPVRIYPSLFEHLPDIWSELATGRAVLLSPDAAEGIAGDERPDSALVMDTPPAPDALAEHIVRLEAMGAAAIDAERRALCRAVLDALRGDRHQRSLATAVTSLSDLLAGALPVPSLDQAARRLLDGRLCAPPIADLAPDPALDRTLDRAQAVPGTGEPSLTVAVACYEMGELLVETIESVWRSTRLPDELLLVDDGSYGAATRQAIERLEAASAARGLPLTVLRQTNQGLAYARNAALAVARSTYISFLDGDDLIEPDFYRVALDILWNNRGIGGVAAWAETFGDGVPPGFWNAPQAELPLLLAENTVIVPCMSPVGLLRRLGGYDVRQRYNYEDWELAIRIVAAGNPIVTIPRYMMRYRVRADSLLRTMSDIQNQVMREELFANHRSTIETFGPELAAQIEHRLMRTLGRQNQTASAPVPGRVALKALRGHMKDGIQRSMKWLAWRTRAFMSRRVRRP